jgi:hypothetical protein
MSESMRATAESADRTALISILRDTRHVETEGTAAILPYTIMISFVGPVLLPPYLPRIQDTMLGSYRQDILDLIRNLAERFWKAHGDHVITPEGARALTERLKDLGSRICHSMHELRKVLVSLAELRVRNVIFLTDDYEIPWALLCVPMGFDHKFLVSEYPCGTLLIDDSDLSLSRLKQHNVGHRRHLPSRPTRVCIVCGDLGGRACQANGAFAYAGCLANFFQGDRTCAFEVKCFGPDDWRPHAHSTRELMGWLNDQVEEAEIVHYIGHVKDGVLWFDERTQIHPEQLADYLIPLDYRPLVVLQACEGAHFTVSNEGGSHLCKVFLEKGASGCVAPVLPVSIPHCLERFDETLMALFYRNIIENDPYGRALAKAQREHQRLWDGDPQGFFFQLFGDPRVVWQPPLGVPKHLQSLIHVMEKGRVPGRPEMLMRVSFQGPELSEAQLGDYVSSVLRTSPVVGSFRQVEAAYQLGFSEVAREAEPYIVVLLTALAGAGGEDAVKAFLTTIGKRLAEMVMARLPGAKPALEPAVKKSPKKRTGARLPGGPLSPGSGKIRIELDKMKVEVGMKDGELEVMIAGPGQLA